jgi:SOS-response transcriptional repressor LexA
MNNSRIAQILTHLMSERDIGVTELARQINLPQPTIYRIVTGVCESPHLSSLKPIADFFSITVEQLRGLDPIHSIEKISKVPIISWHEAINWPSNKDKIKNKSLILTDALISQQGYALYVEDTSMEPIFFQGTLLILDPGRLPKNRSYVIAKLAKFPGPIFRQLVVDINNRYLKPLAPDLSSCKMTFLNNNDKILSTLVQAKRDFEE